MSSNNNENQPNSEEEQNVKSGQKRKRDAVDDGYASSDEESNGSDVEEVSNLGSEEECDSDSASGTESEDDDDGDDNDDDDDDDDDDGDDDDEDDDDSEDEECSSSSGKKINSKEVESEDSASETASREVCAICLSYMKGEIGSPELCDHSFCLECILEWAKTNNSCPQDRTQFLQVFVRKKVKGKIIRIIKVEEVKPDDIPDDEEEEPTFCEVCGRCDREDSLLLCDGCDSGHHLECLSPPLSSVPIEEWYCNECQAVDRLATRRTRNLDVIELEEVTSLIDEAGVETFITADRSIRPATVLRRLPRTRASERIRRRIQRVRTTRGETHQSFEIEEEEDSEEEVELEVSTSSSKSTSKPARKKRKVTIRRKRKTKRKVVKRKTKTGTKKKKTRKSTTTKKKGTTKKKRKTKSTKKKGTKKRKSTTKKRGAKWRKRKGKKKPKSQVVITPKARLAEALGIRPLKNPWQLSLPAMTGGRSQEGASLTNQRWKAGVPSLSLLGSNTELDYLSEPDEFGDAILVAGVARRRQSTTEALARRKAMAVEVLSRSSYSAVRNLDPLPVNDSNVSSMGDLLDNIIQSQSKLHKNAQKVINQSDSSISVPKDQQGLAKQVGTGPDTPNKEGNNQVKTPPRDQNKNGQPRFIYGVYSTAKTSDTFSNNTSVSRNPNNEDPTGSKAYSSYLKDHTTSDIPLPESSNKNSNKKPRKEDRKKKSEEDEVNLYSDIEPEISESDEDESDNDEEVENQVNAKLQDHNDENESPLSGDELVIDDTREKALTNRSLSAGGASGENEVGSSNLPGLNDFELEAVSDTDTHEMDKSMNSSISLSDSNTGDAEVTSSTNEINVGESEHRNSSRMVQLYNSIGLSKSNFEAVANQTIGMGLEGLETETISDNEEICFEDNYGNDDDNIEEGEIPNENAPRALPSNRPKINIQLRRVIEVSSPNKEFEGECEEGEIIDESAAKREKKREKAKRDVEEVVNQQLDEEIKENEDKENVNPEMNTQLILHSEVEINEPEKVLISPDDITSKVKDKKEKQPEKDKEKEKDRDKTKDKPRDKDIAFKKVSRNTKVRNYRDNDKDVRNKRRGSRERSHSRDRGYSREREYSRERGRPRERNRDGGGGGGGYSGDRYRRRDKDRKKEPKRKEMERYNVRQMINKKEEERKKKDEFGRDVSMREIRPSRTRSRSHSKSRGRRRKRSESRSKKGSTSARNKDKFRKSFSRSTSKSRNLSRSRKRRRSSYSSSSSSSSSTSSSSSSSSYSSSSSSSSRSRSRSRRTRERKRLSKSRSKSITKKIDKKKNVPSKPKEKVKKVVVSPQKKKVDEKKKEKRKEKDDPKIEKPKKKKKRDKTPLQSKEVYQAGGSIMVSVNFSRNTAKENKDPKKKKDKEGKADDLKKKKKADKNSGSSPYRPWSPQTHSGSPVGKHTPLQDEPMWSPDTLRHQTRVLENAKSPEVIDLDVIMVTPPPQEPILISDSEEEEEEGITRLPPDLGMQQCSPISRNQGPKTPPEPGVKFTLSTKQALKPITNPLRDEEEEDRSVPVPSRGPNTPPGPPPESDESVGRPKSPIRRVPRSPVGTPPVSSPEPDVYDPFEPTKSPSPPTRSPQQEARVSSSDQTDQILLKSPGTRSPSKSVSSPPPPPPPPSDPPQSEDRPPEPQKAPDDEASSTAPTQPATVTIPTSAPPPPIIPHSVAAPPNQIVTSLPGVISLSTSAHTLPPITTHTNSQPLNQMQQIFAGLPANVANILYPAALAAAAMRGAAANTLLRPPNSQPLVPPDFSRPPPVTPGMLSRPPPISPLKTGRITQNGQNVVDTIDMDLGSPTSPDSSDVSDIFEPPSPLNIVSQEKTSPRKPRPTPQKISPTKQGKHLDKFDALFGSSNDSRNKTTPHKSKQNLNSKLNKLKNLGGKKSEHDEDIPSSAVDLQVKERLLKKVQRQERVVDEVKLCLKPFYNKKTINKDDYKDIMKRCVQKVCHNKSGEINPNKIRGLVEGYIKKVKYYRKKHGAGGAGGILSQIKSGTVLPPSVNDPPPPGFALKSHLKLKP